MKRLLILTAIALSAFAFDKKTNDAAIKIVYVNSFTDLEGNDLTAEMAPFFGRENHYFITNSNYKVYDENNKLLTLYTGSTNTYYSFIGQDDNAAEKTDAATGKSKRLHVKALPDKETICGYVCSAVEISSPDDKTVYYYNSAVSIDKTNYAKHNFGDFNKSLDATNGAVPLKIVMTDKKLKYIWTAEAKEVKRVSMKPEDFELPAGVKITN
jgi:hypothetical protein